MPRERLNNIAFAIIIGAVLGATAWSLAAREPALFNLNVEGLAATTPAQTAEGVATPPTRPTPETAIDTSETRRMIDSGALSRHPARFYRKEPQ